MPSLRRYASSSAVRSSPYALTAPRGNGHRRSSGSETSSRRVLADIEWWRVTDGQCDPAADHDADDAPHDTVAIDLSTLGTGIHIAYVEPSVDSSASLPWIGTPTGVSDETTSAYAPPTAQFSSLSITPHTPTRRQPTLDVSPPLSPSSQSSSLVSSPGSVHTPLDSPAPFGLATNIDMGFLDASLLALPDYHRRSGARYGMLSLEPVSPILVRSFADCFSLSDDGSTKPYYADFAVSPLSSAPDFLN